MKKIIGLSLVAATLLFTGCGEDSKKATSGTATNAAESTKEATISAVDATKEAADKAVAAAKEATTKAVEATKEAAEATKEAAIKAVDGAEKAVAGTTDTAGKEAYAKCAGCHGADGKTKALGKSQIIAGQSKEDLISKIKAYKAGTRNEAGMGNLMKGQVASMDDATIETVATYISTL